MAVASRATVTGSQGWWLPSSEEEDVALSPLAALLLLAVVVVAVGGSAKHPSTSLSLSLAMNPFSSGSQALKARLAAANSCSARVSRTGLRSMPKSTVKCEEDPTTHTGSCGVL